MRLVVADGSAGFRKRLAGILGRVEGMEIVGEAKDVASAAELIERTRPHAAVVDMRTPGGGALELLRRVKAGEFIPRVIVLATGPRSEYRARCTEAGAEYFFDKSSELRKMITLLRNLAQESDGSNTEGRSTMKKRLVVGVGIVAVLAIVAYVELSHGSTPKYSFMLDTVSVGNLTQYVNATGTVNPVTSVDVGTQVSGIISRLYADFNSEVKKGQVLAQIDSTNLAQAVLDARASVAAAQAKLEDSREVLAREKAMHDLGFDAPAEYDSALAREESDEATLQSARASLDEAKTNLAHATIYAPISGVVINRAVSPGQTVAASFSSPTLFTIANNLQKMQVETAVDESDVGMIGVGESATFTVDAYPDDQFSGKVSQVRLDPESVQNVVTYTVVIDVDNDQLKLMPGMTANVRIQVASENNCLEVPNMALRFHPPGEVIEAGYATSSAGATGNGGDPATGKPAAGSGDMRNPSDRNAAQPEGRIRPATNTSFGISGHFPEFEKDAPPSDLAMGKGRIWVVGATGKLRPVSVQTGISDGHYTQVIGPGLQAGERIVLGVQSSNDAGNGTSLSPFGGGTPSYPMRFGFR